MTELTLDDIKQAWVEQFETPEGQEQAALIFQDILNAHDRKVTVQALRDAAAESYSMKHLNGYPVFALPKAELLAAASWIEKGH